MSAADAAAYSAAAGGKSFVVMEDGVITYEDYPLEVSDGYDENTDWHIRSGSKGFWGPVLHKLINDGDIAGLYKRVADLIPEWRSPVWSEHAKLADIELTYIASLTSGLIADQNHLSDVGTQVNDMFEEIREWGTAAAHYLDEAETIELPVTAFSQRQDYIYGPSNFFVFGVIMENLGYAPLTYLQDNFLTPLGITYASWNTDGAGNPTMSRGCHLTAREWVKWVEYLRKELLGEAAILPQWRMRNMLWGTAINPGHGHFIFLNRQGGEGAAAVELAPPGSKGGYMFYDGYGGPYEMFGCLGGGRSVCVCIPKHKLVICRQNPDGDAFTINDFLTAYFQ